MSKTQQFNINADPDLEEMLVPGASSSQSASAASSPGGVSLVDMLSTDAQHTSAPEASPTFWQSYKHILKPVIAVTTVVTAIGTTLAVVLSRHSSSSEPESSHSPESLSAGWSDSLVSQGSSSGSSRVPSQQMLEQLGSYLFNAASVVPSLVALLSASSKLGSGSSSASTSICSSEVWALRNTLDSAMHQGGQVIIQNISGPIACSPSWTSGRMQTLSCKAPTLAESVFANASLYIDKLLCNTSFTSSDPGFIQISFYGKQRSVLYTVKGLPENYQTLSAARSLSQSFSVLDTHSISNSFTSDVTSSESLVDSSSHSATPTNQKTQTFTDSISAEASRSFSQTEVIKYPVGNCTFYNLYLASDTIAARYLGGIPCTTTRLSIRNFFNNQGNGLNLGGLFEYLMPALQQLTAVTSLEAGDNNLGNKGAIVLSQFLQYMTNLTYLDLQGDRIGDSGFMVLSNVISKLTLLDTLLIGGNPISAVACKALADNAFPHLTKMKVLRLTQNSDVGDDGIVALAPGISHFVLLETLDLQSTNTGDRGAIALADALSNTPRLTTLILLEESQQSTIYNKIGAAGAWSLLRVLYNMTQLSYLDLTNNNISTDGAIALADGLQNNTALRYLYLSGNNIGSTGAKVLAPILSRMSRLIELYLNSNDLQDAGAEEFIHCFENVTYLEKAYFWYNNISSAECGDLVSTIGEHYYLRWNFMWPDVHC